jgi:rod shape-determining protein MreB
MERGIMLAGGGSMLRGLDSMLAEETGLPVHVADDPLTCVVMGTGKALDEMDRLKAVIQTTENI